jgi:hypothetical protein
MITVAEHVSESIATEFYGEHGKDWCYQDEGSPIPQATEELKLRFTYHPPKPGQPALYEDLRARGFMMAQFIEENCPDSRERSLAITKIEEAIFWANAAIARRQTENPMAGPTSRDAEQHEH